MFYSFKFVSGRVRAETYIPKKALLHLGNARSDSSANGPERIITLSKISYQKFSYVPFIKEFQKKCRVSVSNTFTRCSYLHKAWNELKSQKTIENCERNVFYNYLS